MKKIFLSASILTFLFTSCKQNNLETTNKKAPDSETTNETNLLIGSWVEPNPINDKEVQGFTLKRDNTAESINMSTLVYKKWWKENGKLVLVEESIGNKVSGIDTMKYSIIKNTDKVLELKDEYSVKFKYTKQ